MESTLSMIFDGAVKAVAIVAIIATLLVILGLIFEEPIKKMFGKARK